MSDLVAIRDHARFTGPSTSSTMVALLRLDERFVSATGQVVRVLAPGGYGKSTLIARWVATDPRRVRWLDVEPIDNDPLVFAHVLYNGLADLERTGLDRRVDDTDPFHTPAQLISGAEPFVLVLDDIHHIVSAESLELVDLIIDNLPPESTLVLAGRAHHHAGAIARQRLRPGVVDVSVDDLAFDAAETKAMLTLLGIESNPDVIAAVTEQFEGWPAGLRLAGQVLATRRDGIEVPLDKLGDIQYVTDYVTEEWFGRLGPDDQSFLREVACLGRFTAQLCDAVLGRHDSASILRRLCRDETVILALDQRGEWYRMHALLTRWLSSRLRSLDPERWGQIHIAAARWWEREADIDLAIGHAAAADDLDLLQSLVMRHGVTHAARGMYSTIQRWMANFTDTQIRSSLPLMQVETLIAIGAGDGDRALNWMRLLWAEHVTFADAPTGPDEVVSLRSEALFAALETRPSAEMIAVASHARQYLPAGELRALASSALGAHMYLCGDTQAIDMLREALFESAAANSTTLQAHISAVLAIVLDLEGHVDEARQLGDCALRLLSTRLVEDLAATAMVLSSAALIDARAGRHDKSNDRLMSARVKLTRIDRCSPWFSIFALTALVRASVLLDDPTTARDLMHQLESKMANQDQTTALAAHVDELGKRVRAAADVFAERSWSLTAAELRVAQYLPTNLSLADIATRLYVSRNTVKSHAAAIYRKLGAASRAEAVDRARRAGLIDETRLIV